MRYVGLDVHKRLVQAHFCDEHGGELRSIRFELTAASLSQFAHDHLGPDCTVALEATTNTYPSVNLRLSDDTDSGDTLRHTLTQEYADDAESTFAFQAPRGHPSLVGRAPGSPA